MEDVENPNLNPNDADGQADAESPEQGKTFGINEPESGGEPLAFDEIEVGEVSEIDQLRGEHKDLQQRLLRVSADYQNYVRRSHLNVQSARDETTSKIVKALVPVMDHLDAALAVDAENMTLESLIAGVKIVGDELNKTLTSFGVNKLTAEPGDEFDPNRHEALMRQPAEGIDTNHVVMMLQAGYTLGDQTLRPVKVTVAE